MSDLDRGHGTRPDSARPHVVVVGAMGVGKSTTGRALAKQLGWPYSDSDEEIESLVGTSGGDFAASNSIALLHELEAALLIGALARSEPHVVTAAASVVENELVCSVLQRRAFVVHLSAPADTVLARQQAGSHRRAMSLDELQALTQRRDPFFKQIRDLHLDASISTESLIGAVIDAQPW